MMYNQNFVAVVKCNGKILRERKGGLVYLPFGSEYSILLKNKDARKALVEIEVAGKNVLKGHKLIVGANESQEIKGFMRNMEDTNSFRFINKTKEIQKHRGDKIDDGLIRITYQFEAQKTEPVTPFYVYENVPSIGEPTRMDHTFRYPGTTAGLVSDHGHSVFNVSSNFVSSKTKSRSVYPDPDEGITVKGSEINQEYVYGDIGTLAVAIHTIVLQLKGRTRTKKIINKPITVKSKLRCETCGRKSRSTSKFCNNCGTCLD